MAVVACAWCPGCSGAVTSAGLATTKFPGRQAPGRHLEDNHTLRRAISAGDAFVHLEVERRPDRNIESTGQDMHQVSSGADAGVELVSSRRACPRQISDPGMQSTLR